MYDIKNNTQPTELITTTDVKRKLNITYTDDDTLLGELIKRARNQVELYCGIAIGSQTKTWTVDCLSYVELPIPYSPIISIDTVSKKTDYATYEVLTVTDDYDIDGQSKLTFTTFSDGRFKVEYTCGYTSLPEGLKDAVLTQVVHLYEHRGDEAQPGLCQMAKDKADQYKDYSWV